MTNDLSAREVLAAIRSECLALGLKEGSEFHVDGFRTCMSSEHIDLQHANGFIEICYADMGEETLVVKTDIAERARREFVARVTRLAAGRNRGPAAGTSEQVPNWRDTMTEEQLVETFLREQRQREL